MKINFIGSFTQGFVGETADELILANALSDLGHEVTKVPRDIWKAHCEGEPTGADWVLPKEADINIICKWHHFVDGKYCRILREETGAPVFYWTWDYMKWPDAPEWHRRMAEAADLHLTNEGGFEEVNYMKQWEIEPYYFPMDVADSQYVSYSIMQPRAKKYDVTFFGSWIGEGVRQTYLPLINKVYPVTAFSWNHKDWPAEFTAYPAVYGQEFNDKVSESKICLQMSVYDDCWGYWSNRTGKTLLAGGFLLARYTPGMELALRDGAEYFREPDEAIEKIKYYLEHGDERTQIAKRGWEIGKEGFTSHARMKELEILIKRFLKGDLI